MLSLPNFWNKGAYIRIGAIGLEEGFEYIRAARFMGKKRRLLMGVDVGFDGNRIATFLYKGVVCANCTLQGSYFAIERCRWGQTNEDKYHANLWGIRNDGSHSLMTSDHIMPKSRGGGSGIMNRQTMCSPCNTRKSDMLPVDFILHQQIHGNRKRKDIPA